MNKKCIIFALTILFISCSGEHREVVQPEPSLKNVSAAQWDMISQKRIYWGHRSIGSNIINGIRDLVQKYPQIKVKISRPEDGIRADEGCVIHYRVGQQASPETIALDFMALSDTAVQRDIDFVLAGFTPFYGEKDMDGILSDYKAAVGFLKKKYPDTIFIHETFPLLHSETTWKTRIKKILGRSGTWEYARNIRINEFNKRLREAYLDKEPFFDIAKIQSTLPDGSRSVFTLAGERYYHMVRDYTYDNYHLNEKGREIVARHLLSLLVSLTGGQ